MPDDEIEGLQGELIDRLIRVLNNDALGGSLWYDVGVWAQALVGGAGAAALPDIGQEPVSGTVGVLMMRGRQRVSRDEWFERLEGRLSELVLSGMDEAFLVRGIRDEIRRKLAHAGDAGSVDRDRAELRMHIRHLLDDPASLSAFRADVAERDPSAAVLSDDEFSARLQRILEGPGFRPISAGDAADWVSALTCWDAQVFSLLSNDVIDLWHTRMVTRLWKGMRR